MFFKQKKLFWQIFLAILVILSIAILLVIWNGSRLIDSFYFKESAADLLNRAYLIESHVVNLLDSGDYEKLRRLAVASGRRSETRITVISADGTVLADSKEDPAKMDNHRTRPEIVTAFGGSPGSSLRFSKTLSERMLYSAILLRSAENPPRFEKAVLRLAIPVTDIDKSLHELNMKIIGGTVIAVLAAFIISLLVSRNITRPLENMTRRAAQYSRGDFSRRVTSNQKTVSHEIHTLSAALDDMADQLDEKIRTIVSQHNQLETVFSSMVEAVIAIDRSDRILSINQAAGRMFGVDREKVQNLLVHEVIRNTELQQQISQVQDSGKAYEGDLIVNLGLKKTYLQSHVVPLQGGKDGRDGILVVLNDVTRMRHLETMRSDFVANVSHELRTPITSIRGYVETLLEGALDDRENATKFLEIVLRQSEQLNDIIEDLMALSRIEQDTREQDISLESAPLKPILESAVETCAHYSNEQQVSIILDCPDDLRLKVNRTLMEQALVNLLHNAITYSKSGSSVDIQVVRLRDAQNRIRISVVDRGIGIAPEHLPRLFERFYRSDRARNRKAGGTGLGLAIVKHIVQAHGGTVAAESEFGSGSTFSIILSAEPDL